MLFTSFRTHEDAVDQTATKVDSMYYLDAAGAVITDNGDYRPLPEVPTKTSFKGYSTFKSFEVLSADRSAWDEIPSAAIGCIVGFAVFALGYAYTIIMIAVDMRRRNAMYQELIDGDLAKLDSMGLGPRMREFEKELAIRLAGVKDDEGVDDQLTTQALELRREEF